MSRNIQFIAPSYMLYADETGASAAYAIFESGHGGMKEVFIPTHTFVEVGGEHIGGPLLTAIKIVWPGLPPVNLIPAIGATVGPNAWAVVQPNGSTEGYGLDIVQEDGSSEIITLFAITKDKKDVPPV